MDYQLFILAYSQRFTVCYFLTKLNVSADSVSVLFIMLAFLLTLPLYLILGVVWRLSVLAGYPVNEVKNKKWRLGLLVTFGVSAIIGIALGMVGMGNSRHFRDGHGVIAPCHLLMSKLTFRRFSASLL